MAEEQNQIPVAPAAPAPKAPNLNDNLPKGEKLLSMLGYISFLCILPLAIKPKSEFCQFHGKQALVLAVLFFVFSGFSFLGSAIAFMVGLLQVIITIFCMLRAYAGKKFKIPVAADIAAKLNW